MTALQAYRDLAGLVSAQRRTLQTSKSLLFALELRCWVCQDFVRKILPSERLPWWSSG